MERAVERGLVWAGLPVIATVARFPSPPATGSWTVTPSRGGSRNREALRPASRVPDTRIRYYVCSKKKANEGKPGVGRYVPAEPLEAEAMALLAELAEHPDMAHTYADTTRHKALPGLREERERLERAVAGCDREVETLLGKLAKEVITDEDFWIARSRLDADRMTWEERLAEIAPLIADEELSARAATAVADALAGVKV